MRERSATDAEVFFVAVLGAALVLLGGGLLFESLGWGSSQGALLARVAPLRTVRALYAWFGLLPAGLAFLGIGLPFALRVVASAARRRLGRREAFALLGIAAGIAALLSPYGHDWKGPLLLLVVAVTAMAGAAPLLAERAAAWGRVLLAAAALSLLVVAVFEQQLLSGNRTGTAVASTAVAAAGFFLAPALGCLVAVGVSGGLRWYWTSSVTLLAGTWYALPWLRTWVTTAAARFDYVELGTTIALALLLAVVVWRGSPPRARTA